MLRAERDLVVGRMSWFARITGFPEGTYAETQARLRVENGRLLPEGGGPGHAVGELELVPLGALRDRTRDVTVPGRLTLGIVEGDVRRMHIEPENAGAVFQVASQFNLLEMTGPTVTPEQGVTGYAHDHTQGPACAIAAGAGTIWRNYLVPVGDQIGQTADRQLDGLADLGAALARDIGVEAGSLWRMRNGYALPDRGTLARIEAHLAGLDEAGRDRLRGLLRVGLHRDVGVTEPGAAPDTRVTQVYCSALPVAYSGIPTAEWAGFASLILEAAYEATVLSAVLNAARGGSRRLLLTRIGGGAFGNAEDWISAALLRALRIAEGQGLDALMVSYGPASPAIREVEGEWGSQVAADHPARRAVSDAPPSGKVWVRVHRALSGFAKTKACVPAAPPKPLILAGAAFSTEPEKADRWRETVKWAERNGCSHLIEEGNDD